MYPCCAGRYRLFAGVCLIWMLTTTSTLAAEPGRVVVSPLATLGKLAAALLIVLAVFWLFARIMRQVQGFQSDMHKGLSIVGSLSLGQRERVVVIQAGDEQLVLGVTSSQINFLHVLESPLSRGSPLVQQGDFKAKLSAALKRQVPGE